MATSKLGADNTGDPGQAFRIVVRICGLLAIAGVFLPFIRSLSIIDMGRHLTEPGSNGVIGNLVEMASGMTAMGSATIIGLMAAYIMFPLIGLMMAVRGKYSGGPFTFLLLFNIGAFLLVNFFGLEAGLEGNFFVHAGIGYWISCAGLFIPFVAMFFLDKSI
ncbi:MAG: hypothetical protein RLZZ165_2454 [Bacteroidota bacterium]|jgi:hypothetical protein